MTRIAPRLIAITDTAVASVHAQLERLDAALAAARPGSVMVQLRDTTLPTRERLAFGQQLRSSTRRHGQWLAVNDRADFALLLEADALHLGERGVLPDDARQLVGTMWISRACHDPASAQPEGANAVILSPVLAPRKGNPPLGLDALASARAAGAPLLYALGGVNADNAAGCVQAGADGVAAIGAVLAPAGAHDLIEALGCLR